MKIKILLLLSLFICGCRDNEKGIMKNIEAKEAMQIIHEQRPILLDVRTSEEYQYERLENSVLIPVQNLEAEIDQLPKDREKIILVYCRSGNRSLTACDILVKHEYKNVYNLVGGMIAWKRSGGAIVK